ncbi:uncharacterized protein TNCT_418961 [Trichonephila clavata]|nr:uncharacterized protein TNCT_418961 [Trichonephila clavata]
MYSSMEALKIEYYEVVKDEQLPNLELILEEMEEDLEEIKVGLQTLLLKHDDISKNVSICNTALSNNGLRNVIDVINKNLRGLKLMDLETNELTHQFLINIIIRKLDIESRKLYEMSLTSTELLKWEMFLEFLQNRTQILENLHG